MQLSASSNMIKRLVEGVIDMKYQEVSENNFQDMTEEEKAEYEEADKQYSDIYKKLEEILSNEQCDLVNECMERLVNVSCLEQRYMFNSGVKAGLRELSFIKKILGSAVVLL